jgi:hypothetical protein
LGDGEDAFRGIGGALGEEVHGVGEIRAGSGGRGGFFRFVRRSWRGGGRRGG